MDVKVSKVNSLAELQRIGYRYEPVGSDEVKILCPVHSESNPSCFLNTSKNVWLCHSCKAKGDVVSLLAHISKCDRKTILADLSGRYDIGVTKSINRELIEVYHSKIWTAGPLLEELRKRGISDDSIRKARLGYNDGRITIPIFNDKGVAINLRKYLPGAPGSEKMRNTKGMTSLALYMPNQMKYDCVWICGGEMKALAASQILNEIAIGAVAVTGSEGSWSKDFNHLLTGKRVFVCMDIDSAGQIASKKLAAQIYHSAKEVRIIRLPLDVTQFPKGDVNDYIVSENPSPDVLAGLMQEAEKFSLDPDEDLDDGEIRDVRLSEVSSAEFVGRFSRCEAIVSAMDENPYLVPKDVEVVCTKDQPNCAFCPVWPNEPDNDKGCVTLTVRDSSHGILELVNCPTKAQGESLRSALRIPKCRVAEYKVVSRYDVLDVRLIPPLRMSGDNSDHVVQPAYVVGKDVELNSPYVFTGKIFPNPKTQQSVFLISSVEQGDDSLEHFDTEDENISCLKIFQPEEWSVDGIRRKLESIYRDMEANVTRIYKREELHLALDLCYYSSLYFDFDGAIQNGWVNTLILGDSSQGKSETSLRMMEFYGLGIRHDCKNASVAGLLGGLQQLGSRWFVSWGVVPLHDRRLVVLEEVKGAAQEVLGRLTDMRSSGIAEVSKIEKRKAHARTRLVFISNPRSDRPVSAYNFGIESIKELMGSLEDIRRFDMAVILSSTQIDPAEINVLSTMREKVDHLYSAELSKKLVLRAWTRSVHDIRFEKEAVNLCLKYATELCNQFTEVLPLCDRGTMRYKIARLSIALANRTFSTVKNNYQVTLVRNCHVEYVYKYLLSLYSDPIFGYKDFTKAQEFANKVSDPELVQKRLLGSKHPKDLVQQLLHADEINTVDIQDWCELDKDDAQKFLSFLVRKHAVYRTKFHYVKTSEFITLLKSIRDSGILNKTKSFDDGEEF